MDRLTDAELDELEAMLPGEWVQRLLAEVREHRAARTLTDEEQVVYDFLRACVESLKDRAPTALLWSMSANVLHIIDRLTGETSQ